MSCFVKSENANTQWVRHNLSKKNTSLFVQLGIWLSGYGQPKRDIQKIIEHMLLNLRGGNAPSWLTLCAFSCLRWKCLGEQLLLQTNFWAKRIMVHAFECSTLKYQKSFTKSRCNQKMNKENNSYMQLKIILCVNTLIDNCESVITDQDHEKLIHSCSISNATTDQTKMPKPNM